MATEGESPIAGALSIGGAGFGLAVAVVFFTLALSMGSWGLVLGGRALAAGSSLAAWLGWREVCEATRFRRGMDAHRVIMLRAKNGL